MNTTQVLNMTFDIWSALFNAILIIGAFIPRRFNPSQAKPIIGALVANASVNVFEALAYVFRGDVSVLGWWMVRITNFGVFLCNHLLLLFAGWFIVRTIERDGHVVNVNFKRMFVGTVMTGVVLLVLARAFGFYYAFDEQNLYYRIRGYWVMIAVLWFAAIALLVLTLVNWQQFTTLERTAFLMIEILPIVAMIAQLFTYGVSLTTFAGTISLAMMFMAYELECARGEAANERKMLDDVIAALAEAVDAKDTYTRGHSARVAEYSRMLARRLGLGRDEVERIYRMAVLHDVGKIGVPDAVLNKPGRLNDEEFALIKSHAALGGDILKTVETMPELTIGARWHHERYDGKGYPDGLENEAIPFEARIICVADSYDAMTSDRVYRDHLPQNVVRYEIERNAGTQFDPDVARAMLEIIDEDTGYRLHD